MSTNLTQLEAEWVHTLDQAETDLVRILGMFPKDQMLPYTRDLRVWAQRVSEEAVARAFRVLNSLGYSRAACATTLGLSPGTLTRILHERSVTPYPTPVNPLTFDIPEDAIDIREQFDALSD